MAITNGYATLEEFLSYLKEYDEEAEVPGEETLELIIEAASRFIDGEALQTFYGRTETHRFDVPEGRALRLDDNLLAVTTLTNGDGSVIAASNYVLWPANVNAKRGIHLKAGSSVLWQGDSNGNTEQVISVLGPWGRFAEAPSDIKLNCLEIARAANNRRTGQTAEAAARVTAAGVVIEPADVPKQALRNIRKYRRMT